jgi:hypothetical protein
VPSANPHTGGKERYLGNEWVVALSYRFAPNITFDLSGAALITGDALNINRSAALQALPGGGSCSTAGVPTCESKNVYKASARMRLTF